MSKCKFEDFWRIYFIPYLIHNYNRDVKKRLSLKEQREKYNELFRKHGESLDYSRILLNPEYCKKLFCNIIIQYSIDVDCDQPFNDFIMELKEKLYYDSVSTLLRKQFGINEIIEDENELCQVISSSIIDGYIGKYEFDYLFVPKKLDVELLIKLGFTVFDVHYNNFNKYITGVILDNVDNRNVLRLELYQYLKTGCIEDTGILRRLIDEGLTLEEIEKLI